MVLINNMANPITEKMETGTLGELLVQLRLLEYGVQADRGIIDTGNDLIAIKGKTVKFVQIKTSRHGIPADRNFPNIWDIACLVDLRVDSDGLLLDQSKIYILEKGKDTINELNQDLADKIWACAPDYINDEVIKTKISEEDAIKLDFIQNGPYPGIDPSNMEVINISELSKECTQCSRSIPLLEIICSHCGVEQQ